MSAPGRWYVARYRAYLGHWTLEVFMSSGGGWWSKCYDARTGAERETGGRAEDSLSVARAKATKAARGER